MKQIQTRGMALVLALCVMVGVWPAVTGTAKAANANTSIAAATKVVSGQTVEVTVEPGEVLYYAVTADKAGQFLQATATTMDVNMWFENAEGKHFNSISSDNTTLAIAEAAETYYLQINGNGLNVAVTFSLTVTMIDNDKYEPNDQQNTAAEIQNGETVEFVWAQMDTDLFKITTTKPGQQLVLTSDNTSLYYSVYDTNANGLDMYYMGSGIRCVMTNEAGAYYIRPEFRSGNINGVVSSSFTVTLGDNDDYEPNNNLEDAKKITAGQPVDILVNSYDEDWFAIELEAGQFVTATMSQGNVYASICGEDGIDLNYSRSGNSWSAVAEEGGTYYIYCYNHSSMDMVGDTLTVTVADNDAYEYNGSVETAAELTVGESVNLILGQGDYDWFKVTTTKPGQIITAAVQASENVETDIYDSTGMTEINGWNGTDYTVSAVTGEVGTYYVRCTSWNKAGLNSATLTVTLTDNDECEPNAAKESAYELASGQTAEFILAGSDEDWFAVTTTKDGQDIQVDISGFNYANKGRLYVSYDETITDVYVTGNGTWYFHAAAAGTHYIKLYDGYSSTGDVLKLAVTATVLDGDKHESGGNDSAEKAVTLNLGTDETFHIGGWGDEDWFQFEVAPEEGGSNLYTLQFLDLNPDYSDELFYEVYAPDGTVVVARTFVNIHHSNILACDQQGMYQVRVFSRYYDTYWYQYVNSITRSDLRIRVSMGGADPYENNDTWLEAKPIQPGQLIQHVLAATSDDDWFYFAAEEADMSFVMEFDQPTYYALYRAEDLVEYGTGAEAIGSKNYSSSGGTYYYKLDGAGVYYLRLSTGTAYVSEELRSFTITLEPHSGEENNDTWDKAVPIYEGVPQEFDIAGYNDTDWFAFTVPEGATKATLAGSGSGSYYVYREEDIINVGLNAKYVFASSMYYTRSMDVSEGTYYIKAYTSTWDDTTRAIDCTLTYYLSYEAAGGSTIADAVALEPGVWSEERSTDTYYSLGTLSAGDVVRYNRDGSGNSGSVRLYYSNGNQAGYSSYANGSFSISSDGEYYLRVDAAFGVNANGELYTSRIRYDIGTGSDYATTLEGPDTITLTVGEKQYLDLRLAPYTARNGSGSHIYINNNNASSVATYGDYTGYVTAAEVGSREMIFKVWLYGSTYLTKTVTVNVVEPVAATGVSITNAPEEMELGSSVQLTATLTPVEATEDVVWSSSDTDILYVTPGGKVVAVGEGEAAITATVAAGSDSVTIKVVPAEATEDDITSIQLDNYALTMYMGEGTQKLTAAVLPEGIAATVKWTSSNTAAATVDQNGGITAVAPGISIITAAAGDYNASCIVTVQAARVRVTGISFAEKTLQIPLGGQTTLVPTIEPYNATTKTLTWVSDDESVATVSRTGIVNALAVGVTTIRATTLDGGFVAEITIEVTAKAQLGDINGDGYIDSGDAMITLQVAVGLRTLTEEEAQAADVNKDGYVDAGDGVKLLRYDARLIDSLE